MPTCTLGDCGLILVQSVPTSKFISLEPKSAMADDFDETCVVVANGDTVVMGNSEVGLN